MRAFSAWRWILAGAICFAGACVVTPARANETPDSQQCPASASTRAETFHRLHQVPVKDRRRLPMVTPGGMILELPKMVAATDVLTISARNDASFCFQLVTFGRNRQKCVLIGTAQRESADAYLFRSETASLRFRLTEPNQIQVEPIGATGRRHCDALDEMESATYTRAA